MEEKTCPFCGCAKVTLVSKIGGIIRPTCQCEKEFGKVRA